MEDRFIEIIDAAIGWSADKSAAAIIGLAGNYMLKRFAIENTERLIKAAIERHQSRGASDER